MNLNELTPTQRHAVAAAVSSADNAILTLGSKGGLIFPPSAIPLLRASLVSLQLGMMREVAQFSANQRAEVARLSEDECLAIAMSFAKPRT